MNPWILGPKKKLFKEDVYSPRFNVRISGHYVYLFYYINSLINSIESLVNYLQGGAEHLVFPEKGKRAKLIFGKGRFQSQNRAIKTNKGVFGMK